MMSQSYQQMKDILKKSKMLLQEGVDVLEGDKKVTVEKILQRLNAKTFRVAVVATTSAGKSTFVNSILGMDLLPTSDEPKTPFPTYIKPCSIQEHPYYQAFYRDGTKSEKYSLSLDELTDATKQINDWMTHEDMAEKITELHIYTKLAAFELSHDVYLPNIEIVDTPGPTSFGFSSHTMKAFEAIQEANACIFLFKKKGGFDSGSRELLTSIQKAWSNLEDSEQQIKRLFFAMNYADDRGDGQGKTPNQIAQDIHHSLENDVFKHTVRPVYPISAKASFYARTYEKNMLDRKQIRQMKKIIEEYKFFAEEEGVDELNQFSGTDTEFLMFASNVGRLENEIYTYLVEHALKDLVESCLLEYLNLLKVVEQEQKAIIYLWNNRRDNLSIHMEKIRQWMDTCQKGLGELLSNWGRLLGYDIDQKTNTLRNQIETDFNELIKEFRKDFTKLEGSIFTKLVKNIWKRLNFQKTEQFETKEKLHERVQEIQNAVREVFETKLQEGVVSIHQEYRRVVEAGNQEAKEKTLGVFKTLQKDVNRELQLPEEMHLTINVPISPITEVKREDVENLVVIHSKTEDVIVKHRPFYFLFLIEVERTVKKEKEVYNLEVHDLLEVIGRHYIQLLRKEVDQIQRISKKQHIDEVKEYYANFLRTYSSSIEDILHEAQIEWESHLAQENAIQEKEKGLQNLRDTQSQLSNFLTYF